jgi:prepilin-type N-terminal cleavage/methylation domain-containing protein
VKCISKGFTLIEIIMVCLIIALVAGIAVANFRVQYGQSQISQTKGNLESIRTAVAMFYEEEKQWPANDLSNLVDGSSPSGHVYLTRIPKDGIKNNDAVTNAPDYVSGGWYWDTFNHEVHINLSGMDINGDQYSEY